MQAISLVSILLITLIYLHVKASHLIFQRDVKIAKNLSIIVLILTAGSNCFGIIVTKREVVELAYLCNGIIWVLLVTAYWKLLSGCYNDALFKKNESLDPAIREKVRGILLTVIYKKKLTPEWKNFLKVNSNDPLIEEIRGKCGKMRPLESITDELFNKDDFEKLKYFAEQLAN